MSTVQHPRSPFFNLVSYDKVSNSVAKQKFSFSKADRFPSLKSNTQNTPTGYLLPSQLNKRSAGFGFGEKQGVRTSTSKGKCATDNENQLILLHVQTCHLQLLTALNRSSTKMSKRHLEIKLLLERLYPDLMKRVQQTDSATERNRSASEQAERIFPKLW